MSLPGRRAKRRDANESDIVKALERAGALVYRLDQPADLLVGYHRAWWLLEVKDGTKPASKRQLTSSEAIVAAECQWQGLYYAVVLSVQDALQAVGAIR